MASMPDTAPQPDARTLAATLGLELGPGHLPGVERNLGLAARMAALIEAVPLTPADEPAPVFRPGR